MGKKSKSSSKPWKGAIPYIKDAMGTTQNVVNSNQGNLEAIAGGIQSQLPTLQNWAFGAKPGLQAAQGYNLDVLGGRYLSGNPELENMINLSQDDAADRVNSLFARAGVPMSSTHAGTLAREMGNIGSSMRFNNYANERAAMGQAAAMQPSLEQAQYSGVAPWLMAAQGAGNLPYAGIGALAPIIGLGGGGTQTQTPGIGQTIGNIASTALLAFSDRRLKENVRKLHEFDDGLGWYAFNYRDEPGIERTGVMADEVERLRPYALGPVVNGYATVNYGAL